MLKDFYLATENSPGLSIPVQMLQRLDEKLSRRQALLESRRGRLDRKLHLVWLTMLMNGLGFIGFQHSHLVYRV